MIRRPAVWIVGALAVAVVLSMLAGPVGAVALLVAVPVAVVVGSILTRRSSTAQAGRDVAEGLVSAAAALTGEPTSPDADQAGWGAALRAELASITVPRERRRFARGAVAALLGRPHRRRSLLLAAGVAVAFGAGLLGVSRAGLGDDGLGSVTMLVPPLLLFAVGYLSGRSTRSLRFGLETGLLATVTTLVAVAVVYGIEAAYWYDLAPGVSVLDGEHITVAATRPAVLDAVHPVILVVHLLFWSPWPLLGAVAGARTPRAATGAHDSPP